MRRLLLAVIMAAALSPAYADQAPDTLVVTGPNFQQIPTVSLLVTIAGQQQTLGDLLSEAVFPPVTSVAGRIGAVVLSTTDIGGLGSIATQSAGAVAITGGTIAGLSSLSSNGPLQLTGAGTSGQYDAQCFATGGGSAAGLGELNCQATFVQFLGWDGSTQAAFGNTPYATEHVQIQGGPTGRGATVYATNALPATLGTGNVSGSLVAQGQGGWNIANGSGQMAQFIDAAAPTNAALTFMGGTTTSNPTVGSNISGMVDLGGGLTTGVRFLVNGAVQGSAENFNSLSTTGAYMTLVGSSGTLPEMQCRNTARTGVVNCFIRAQSTGNVTLANFSGNLASYGNANDNTAADNAKIQAAGATQPVIITSGAGTSIGVGTPSLTQSATTGFPMMPTCPSAGGPTGVPAKTTGWAAHCYNPTTHMLDIYDTTASGWYHVALTAGAG